MYHLLSSGNSISSNLGGLLSGLSELLIAIGGGVGFVIRMRRNARREHLRTEAAAALAARKARETLEEKLEQQHKGQLEQAIQANKDMEVLHRTQIAQLEGQLKMQQEINNNLLKRILNGDYDDHRRR